MGVNSPGQNVVAGIVLIVAVGFDTSTGAGAADDDGSEQEDTTGDRRGADAARRDAQDINVAFGGVHAVREVMIDLYAGEVIGLVGGNGAGKSTLMRVLSGAHPPTRARSASTASPLASATRATPRRYNIETIYQTLALADNIDAPGNLFLGRERRRASARSTTRAWRPRRARSWPGSTPTSRTSPSR